MPSLRYASRAGLRIQKMVEQIPVLVVQRPDLPMFHRRAEKAGGLAGRRQSGIPDRRETVLPLPPPVNEGIFFSVFGILEVIDQGMIPPPLLSGIVADVLDNFFPSCPYLPAGRVVVAELVLWTRLVFEGTFGPPPQGWWSGDRGRARYIRRMRRSF